ncbi:MAG: YceI family protein [Aurantibacter sp.]
MEKSNKKMLVLLFVLLGGIASKLTAQEKYIDKNGIIIFEASEALFEEVKAKNESVTVIMDTETNQIASLALMKGFRFKNSLMEEHFNENYIESEDYPKATFKGKLVDFDANDLTEDSIEVSVEGVLELHGKQKQINPKLQVQKIGNTISITGEFITTPGDFDIEIPKIVRNKIAKEVNVKLDFKLEKK